LRPAASRFATLICAPLLIAACATAREPARSVPPQTAASQPQAAQRYFDASVLDLTRLLPPPPANDSPETRAELDQMLKVQQVRGAHESERARADAAVNIYRLADALGSPAAFNANRLPLTEAMFGKVLNSELAVVGAAKKYYGRPRPFRVEKKLEPVVAADGGSYPSGHSSWVRAVALVLADMVPERRAQIIARADEYAHNRVVAGVHYPSDVEAGKLAGTAIAAALYASPDFRRDLAAATTELRQALSLPAAPSASAGATPSAPMPNPAAAQPAQAATH
jgi:acid phosphatase (class A)